MYLPWLNLGKVLGLELGNLTPFSVGFDPTHCRYYLCDHVLLRVMIGFLRVIALINCQMHTRILHPENRQQVFGAVAGEWMSKV